MQKVYIATSRPIGEKCLAWARQNMPLGYELTQEYMSQSDVFISVMYDKLVPQEFVEQRRCYNFHPGILPDYRGSGAYSWVLINGEKQTGVTLHEIDKDIDHGGIHDVQHFAIMPSDTAEDLFFAAERLIFTMFQDWFRALCIGALPKPKENTGGHLYLRKDLEEEKDLSRFVRAFTFTGKEDAYYISKSGMKVYLNYNA